MRRTATDCSFAEPAKRQHNVSFLGLHVRCNSFDPSVASIGAVGGRRWVGVDHVTCVGGRAGDSANSYTLLACTNDSNLSI